MGKVHFVIVTLVILTLACQMSVRSTEMPPEDTESDLMLAMVALNGASLPPEQEIFEYLEQTWPSSPTITDVTRKDDAVTFSVSDGVGFFALVSAPIPWDDLEGPCATAWYWPDACEKLKGHKAHAVVSLSSTSLEPVEQALLLTKLLASVAATTDSAGIYWGAGTVVHSPEMFLDQSSGIALEYLPLMLWIDFRLQEEADGTFTMFTTGLEAFGLMEIEAVRVKGDSEGLYGLVYDVAHYLLENGPIVKDGDTIGGSEAEHIEVRYEPSMWDNSRKVYRLVFP